MRIFKILRIAGLHYKAAVLQMDKMIENNYELGYQALLDKILGKHFIYSNAFFKAMLEMGHDPAEIIYDYAPLQKLWVREHNLEFEGDAPTLPVLLNQIKTIQPEILYLQDLHSLPFEVRRNLKERFPFLKKVVLFKGFPGAFDELEGIDLILAATPGLVEQFREAGHPNVQLVYHGFDASKSLPKRKISKASGFSFVGTTGCGFSGNQHQKRYRTLFRLMEDSPLEIWANERKLRFPWSLEGRPTRTLSRNGFRRVLSLIPARVLETMIASDLAPKGIAKKLDEILLEKKASFLFPKLGEKGLESMVCAGTLPQRLRHLAEIHLAEWRAYSVYGLQEPVNGDPNVVRTDPYQPWIPLSDLFPTRCHPPVFGEAMYEVLRCSCVSLNTHTEAVEGEVGNMRLFEVTGIGGCLLTDNGSNLKDLFEPDIEIATYSSHEECVEKANYLLANENVRNEMARAGRERTLSGHTISHRCQEIDSHIQKLFN